MLTSSQNLSKCVKLKRGLGPTTGTVVAYSQLVLWTLLGTRPEGPLPSATFAKERYCSFTLSALSEVFTTYHPFKHCAVTTA
uniref:Uncharacterized protein n=1 Tax=Zea mays TaxID=4577 RepID=C0HEM8_MAIZE|nr:unknown [Zea mays]